MQTIGERLEDARKKKGISIREAAEATKIRGEYLSRFENNQFDINLTDLYVRGFLRSYALFLHLPPDRIVNDFAALARGASRSRQPTREIYGRMDVSVATADDAAEAPETGSEQPTSAPMPARPTRAAPRRPAPRGGGINPQLVFSALKLAGLVGMALLVLWALTSWLEGTPSPSATRRPAPTPAVMAPPAVPMIAVIALGPVRLNVKVKNPDGSPGEVLLADVTLDRGERRTVPKRTALYLTANALENVALEENGRTTAIRDQGISGYSRVQIGR